MCGFRNLFYVNGGADSKNSNHIDPTHVLDCHFAKFFVRVIFGQILKILTLNIKYGLRGLLQISGGADYKNSSLCDHTDS